MRTSKCKRVARMISFFVAGDLVGAPEREVATHLAVCERCRQLAEEFSDSSSLLTQAFAPPEFGAEFYSGIRDAVLGEITRDQRRSKPALFRRPWIYATAFAAVVVISGVMVQHFGGTRRATPPDLARAPQVTAQPTSLSLEVEVPSPRKKHELPGKRSAQSSNVLALANPHLSSRDLIASQATRDGGTQIEPVVQSPTRVGPVALAASSQISRIEIQTADPNIRIIWVTPGDSREP